MLNDSAHILRATNERSKSHKLEVREVMRSWYCQKACVRWYSKDRSYALLCPILDLAMQVQEKRYALRQDGVEIDQEENGSHAQSDNKNLDKNACVVPQALRRGMS